MYSHVDQEFHMAHMTHMTKAVGVLIANNQEVVGVGNGCSWQQSLTRHVQAMLILEASRTQTLPPFHIV